MVERIKENNYFKVLPKDIQIRIDAMDSLDVAMVITEESGTILWANEAWSRLSGYMLEEAYGKNPKVLVRSGIMQDEFYSLLWQRLNSNLVWNGRLINKRKNGQYYHEEMTITPFFSTTDQKKYFVAVKQDISLRENISDFNQKNKEKIFFDIGADIMVSLNQQGNIEDISEKGAELLEFKKEDLIGKNWFETTSLSTEKDELKEVFDEIMTGKQKLHQKHLSRIITKSGLIRQLKWHNEIYTNAEGKINGIFSSAIDITDLVEKSIQMAQQNSLLSIESNIAKLIQTIEDKKDILELLTHHIYQSPYISGVWLGTFNTETKFIQYDQKGFEPKKFDQILKKSFTQATHEYLNRHFNADEIMFFGKSAGESIPDCPFHDLEMNGPVASWKFHFKLHLQVYIFVLFSSEVQFTDSEKKIVEAIFNLIRVLLEKKDADKRQKQAEFKLKDSEGRHRIIFENNLTANYITTPEGAIVDCNNAFLELLELQNLNEALVSDPRRFYPPNFSRNDFLSRLTKYRRIENLEREYFTKSGRKFTVLENTIGIFDEEGTLKEIHGFLVDITELKSKEQRLKDALEKAKESDRLKSAFLSNISHEIRTPMNHIMGFAHVLRETELDKETTKEILKTIEQSGDKLVKMIGEIIDLSKLDAGQLKLHPEVFSLNELFHCIINDAQVQLVDEKAHVKIVSNNDLTRNIEIYADRNRLAQILENLVSNAIKFSMRGTIKIGYRIEKNVLKMEVADEGCGIKLSEQKNIFKRFTKGHGTDFANAGGTGLGLSLVDELVKLMNGKITLNSSFGTGSHFSIELPDIKTKEEILIDRKNLKISGRMNNLKILIAEDDESNFQLLRILLKPFQAEIFRAWNGVEAIEIIRENPHIDLILMDLKMPEMDGFIASREIKLLRPELPIIAQTAYALVGDKEKALDSGCDFYISKPIDHRKLKEVIEKALLLK
ncbi:MAG: PAS domain S-box protein [Bacteroidales bacterium]|nr:PAS domain S-box protein [Bacteroidales bacterium]